MPCQLSLCNAYSSLSALGGFSAAQLHVRQSSAHHSPPRPRSSPAGSRGRGHDPGTRHDRLTAGESRVRPTAGTPGGRTISGGRQSVQIFSRGTSQARGTRQVFRKGGQVCVSLHFMPRGIEQNVLLVFINERLPPHPHDTS